jgi:hypothetical protein
VLSAPERSVDGAGCPRKVAGGQASDHDETGRNAMKLRTPLLAAILLAGSASLALAQGSGGPSSGHSSGASTSSGNNSGSGGDPGNAPRNSGR